MGRTQALQWHVYVQSHTTKLQIELRGPKSAREIYVACLPIDRLEYAEALCRYLNIWAPFNNRDEVRRKLDLMPLDGNINHIPLCEALKQCIKDSKDTLAKLQNEEDAIRQRLEAEIGRIQDRRLRTRLTINNCEITLQDVQSYSIA